MGIGEAAASLTETFIFPHAASSSPPPSLVPFSDGHDGFRIGNPHSVTMATMATGRNKLMRGPHAELLTVFRNTRRTQGEPAVIPH